jgi:hypothetical protein
MDPLPNVPLAWIPILAAALAIAGLLSVADMPLWLVWSAGGVAMGIIAVVAAVHWFNLFRGRPHA